MKEKEMKKPTFIQAIKDERIFKPFLTQVTGSLTSWRHWLVIAKIISGVKRLNDEEMALLFECTGLREVPERPLKELFLCIGRRGGKTTFVVLKAAYDAIWGGWEKYLGPGEKGYIFLIAATKDQCDVAMDKLSALFDSNQFFKRLVKKELAQSIELVNNIIISVKPASWRSTRGYTVGLLIMEELAFWRFEEESANRDREVLVAVSPGMMTIKNSLTLGISTPFARQGLLFEKFSRHWGKPGSVMVWRAPTWVMNLTTTKEELEAENLEKLGEAEFGAEYGAMFREDIEGYMPLDIYERAVVVGRSILGEEEAVSYVAFCDPSEGLRKGADSMTFAIAHKEEIDGEMTYILDVILEFRAPFSPEQVISSIVKICEQYRITKIVQDRHAIAWIAKDFKSYDIEVEVAEHTKSEIYELFAIEMNKNRVRLLDNKRLKAQTMGLQRFLKGGGLVKIDHYKGGNDDVVNSAAGAIVLLSEGGGHEPGVGIPNVGIGDIWS